MTPRIAEFGVGGGWIFKGFGWFRLITMICVISRYIVGVVVCGRRGKGRGGRGEGAGRG